MKIFVGMSGGVDSSVTASLLVAQGYDVTGVYMKNWSQDLPGFPCPWREDYRDAKRVAVQLGIPFEVFDFEEEYQARVVDYMIEEYKAGRTPNPDVMCNQEIKFKIFLQTALERGADMIATGHYARTNSKETRGNNQEPARLLMAQDGNKDQTYFLYRVTEEALSKTLFPLGELTKPEVREIAKKHNLVTASKKESMGICFVGKVGIREFLSQYVQTEAGDILDPSGTVVGRHDGAIFYTIGQRHGLDVGGGLPYYVVGKSMEKNEVYVSHDLSDESLWRPELTLSDLYWINDAPEAGKHYQVRLRHRAPLVDCTIDIKEDGRAVVSLSDQVRACAPGQSAVIYDEQVVVGGGIII